MNRVGIDVGGTKCLGVLIDGTGTVVRTLRTTTPHADDLVDHLATMHQELAPGSPLGIGVPGLITPDGVIRASPNLVGARDVPVGPALRERVATTVTVENDATMAAHGEWVAGAAKGCANALMVTLGTGIGGGIVMGGRLQRGAHGFAGEIGHITIVRDGLECPCGRRGCWERYASGSALSRLGGGIDGPALFAACANGDQDARRAVEEFVEWIAIGLASLTNVCDPERIVLGGGVVESLVDHFGLLADAFANALYSPRFRPHPELVPAVLGESAGAVGAAMFAGERSD